MPTQPIAIYSGQVVDPVFNAEDAMSSMVVVKLAASTTYAAGTVLGEVTTTPGLYKPYASGNVDGSQNPTGILRRPAITDASSNITNSEWGIPSLAASMFTQGAFRTQDLTGFDANAATKLGGHFIEGTVTTGIYSY